jgi:trans-2,3-dihydro-3-hydroxyanthranilate isomerase
MKSVTQGTLPFHFVDVFAVGPMSGNPLVVVDARCELLPDLMQRIAREFNQSETTFVLPPSRRDADWSLRSFTPAGVEVFGAGGHNTLGAWWCLAASGRLVLRGNETCFRQQIGAFVYPLSIWCVNGHLDRVIMPQQAPVTGLEPGDLGLLADALGLARADIAPVIPCRVVSTGVAQLLVPIRGCDAVDRSSPRSERLLEVLEQVGAEGCYLFSLESRHVAANAYARFFNSTVGIAEDPATGTAAGPLAAHLTRHGLAPQGLLRIEQGTALGRQSLIDVFVDGDAVSISARCVVVASGELLGVPVH